MGPTDLVCTCLYHRNHDECRPRTLCWSNGRYTRTELACDCAPWPERDDMPDSPAPYCEHCGYRHHGSCASQDDPTRETS